VPVTQQIDIPPRNLNPRRPPHYAWVVIAITFFALIVAAGVRSVPGILIVPLEREFGWQRSTISLAVSINLLLYGLIGPFAAGLMNRFGVRRVILAAFDVRFDQLGRDQLHRMPERLQQPCPMMAGTTRFDRDHRRRKLVEEGHHVLAPQLLTQNWHLGGIDPVKLENVLRRIHADADNLFHGRSPF